MHTTVAHYFVLVKVFVPFRVVTHSALWFIASELYTLYFLKLYFLSTVHILKAGGWAGGYVGTSQYGALYVY